MLYPQSNAFRQSKDLSGFWTFRFDPENAGERAGWMNGVPGGRPIAVPASWNDQFAEGRDYLSYAWYQTTFDLPWGWQGQRIFIRFGSVNYLAEVWLNGARLGQHEGGHLPFVFEITDRVKPADNLLVVRVEGELRPDRVPPRQPEGIRWMPSYPLTNFDFFPFCGIQRPVMLYCTPQAAIEDITVVTEIEGNAGRVRVSVTQSSGAPVTARLALEGHGASVVETMDWAGKTGEATLTVPDAALWVPGAPNLYGLRVELRQGGRTIDTYTLPVGIRTVAVDGDRLLLNGEPVILKGFGRHEDFPVVGKGMLPALIVKDYALMEWIGANSFRSTHYPYSDEMMDLADRLGVLVIDETPAVGLYFHEAGLKERLRMCQQYVEEMIRRDKNHPSVIMWSIANEPHSTQAGHHAFFRELYDLARALDNTRPVTLVSMLPPDVETSFDFFDVVCLNRYYGWYVHPGQIEEGVERLSAELDAYYAKYHKPIILTEFGADTVPGHHAVEPEMFSEEYQAEFLAAYVKLLNSKPFVVGQHVWNLCDFKTGQGIHRVNALNLKGVFTRDRRPKLAAHRLRALWRGDAD